MLYSKNGSIPKPETDGTEGWIEVPEPPVAKENEEVVWWFPPGWVVRPTMPEQVEGHCWSWSQSETQWILCEDHQHTLQTIDTIEFSNSSNDSTTIFSGASAGFSITI